MERNEGNSAHSLNPLPDAMPFTPLLEGERQEFTVSPADSLKLTKGLEYKGEVTDLASGRRFEVYGIPCPAPRCYCDAAVIEI